MTYLSWADLEDEPDQTTALTLRITYRTPPETHDGPADIQRYLLDSISDHLTYAHKDGEVPCIVYAVTA